MDAKITKKRLSQLLSYDWLKIILTAIGAIIVWELAFTTTATRILPSQNFGVYSYLGSTGTTRFNNYANLASNFSYEVIEGSAQDISTGGDEYAFQLMEARLSTDEADVIMVADAPGGYIQYVTPEGEQKTVETYLQDCLYRYYSYAYRLDGEDGYLAQMAEYLNSYYGGNYETGVLDEKKVETDFLARVKKNKDKRYKTEAKIQQGLEGEKERLALYRQNLIDFNAYLSAGYIALTETTLHFTYENETTTLTGCYSINLCPNEDTMGNLERDIYYVVNDEESGKTKTTALNMNLIIVHDVETEKGFEFERLGFVNYLVETHLTVKTQE